MADDPIKADAGQPENAESFRTTHWSVVVEAGGDAQGATAALEKLCRIYWYPLYACVRRKGHGPEDAQDLTQEFFSRLLRLQSLKEVGRSKGRFRTFLLASLDHFLADAWDKKKALKRGGGVSPVSLDDVEDRYLAEPSASLSADRLFDRRWALTVLNRAMEALKESFAASGKTEQFLALQHLLSNEATPGDHELLASQLNMTPRAVSMAVYRLRQRYAECVRAEVADTVANPAEVEGELNYLLEVVGCQE